MIVLPTLYAQQLKTNLSDEELAKLLVVATKGKICCKQYELLQVNNVSLNDSMKFLRDSVYKYKNLFLKEQKESQKIYKDYLKSKSDYDHLKLRLYLSFGVVAVTIIGFILKKIGILRFL